MVPQRAGAPAALTDAALLAPLRERGGQRAQQCILDGKLVMQTRLGSPELEAAFDARKGSAAWRTLAKRESPIVLTHHRTPVWYRNVRVRRLP